MSRHFNSGARGMAVTAMVVALNVVLLLLASIIPGGRLGFLFISALTMAVLMTESWVVNAFAAYVASGILAMLLLPNKGIALAYILMFGHYGIVHQLLKRIPKRIIGLILSWVYFNAAVVAAYLLTRELFFAGLDIEGLIVWFILGVQVLFFIADYLYGRLVDLYVQRFRAHIIK